jgi:hypothetical protein
MTIINFTYDLASTRGGNTFYGMSRLSLLFHRNMRFLLLNVWITVLNFILRMLLYKTEVKEKFDDPVLRTGELYLEYPLFPLFPEHELTFLLLLM